MSNLIEKRELCNQNGHYVGHMVMWHKHGIV